MKEQMLKIAKDLEQGMINETEAQNLLLGLFGVIKSVCDCNDLEYCNGVYKSCRECGKLHSAWK
jgi:hypothetical protein